VVGVPTTGNGPILSYAVPTTREAGIWSPAGGVVVGGRLFYPVGNGESQSGYDGSDSIIALSAELQRTDFFAPTTWVDDNAKDLDLGSMTPAVVGPYLFIAGKRRVGYVVRQDRLGQIGGEVSQAQVCGGFGGAAVVGTTVYVPCADGVRSVNIDVAGKITMGWHGPGGAKGSPIVGGGLVWVVDYDGGILYGLDPASGATRQRVNIGTAPHFASPTMVAGHIFVGTLSGVTGVAVS
jgi:hypothetical protein